MRRPAGPVEVQLNRWPLAGGAAATVGTLDTNDGIADELTVATASGVVILTLPDESGPFLLGFDGSITGLLNDSAPGAGRAFGNYNSFRATVDGDTLYYASRDDALDAPIPDFYLTRVPLTLGPASAVFVAPEQSGLGAPNGIVVAGDSVYFGSSGYGVAYRVCK